MSNDFATAFGIRLSAGISVLQDVPEPTHTFWKDRYLQALKGDEMNFEDSFNIEGIPNYISVTMVPIVEQGNVIGVACTSHDITIQKTAQLQVLQNEAYLKAQIECTDESIWSVDDQYCLLTINSNMIKGYSRVFNQHLKVGDNIINTSPEFLQGLWKGRYDRCLKGEKFSEIDEFEIGDELQFIEFTFNPISVNGTIVGVACFSKDISAMKSSEIELQKALETKNKFFSIIAHDLRGPIGNIRELVKMISGNSIELPEEHKMEALRYLSTATDNAYELLDNLLQWGLTQRNMVKLEPSHLNVRELLSESIKAYLPSAQSKKIETQISVGEELSICSDKRTLSNVLANLYNNAVKFTDTAGKISLEASAIEDGVKFKVIDNGCGMEQFAANQLLTDSDELNSSKDGTKKEKGSGLGLMLCKEFVSLNGGSISVLSSLDAGTIFEFFIPNKVI